jgi:hypothetical protein
MYLFLAITVPPTPQTPPVDPNLELAHPLQRISSSTNEKKNAMRVLAVEVRDRGRGTGEGEKGRGSRGECPNGSFHFRTTQLT